MSQKTKNKYRKNTKSCDTINQTKAVKIVDDRTTTIFTLRWRPRKLKCDITKQILVYRKKTNGFFVIKNTRKRIYIKRFNEICVYGILQIETDYPKRKFIEWFHINSLSSVLNDKKSVCFPSIYQNSFRGERWSLRDRSSCTVCSYIIDS